MGCHGAWTGLGLGYLLLFVFIILCFEGEGAAEVYEDSDIIANATQTHELPSTTEVSVMD
jgi:hypothetical protein